MRMFPTDLGPTCSLTGSLAGGRTAAVWRRVAVIVAVPLASLCLTKPAAAQNDWQYPDPYFGILEIEKSHDAATTRRYRAEVNPAPRRPFWAPDGATFGTAPTDQPAAPRPQRSRWRTRSRR